MRFSGQMVLAVLSIALAGGCGAADETAAAAAGGSEVSDAVTAAAEQPAAPDWARPGRPVIRDDMEPGEFDHRFAEAREELADIAGRENEPGAAWGYRLNKVDPDSQGQKVGLVVGDTIVAVDGKRGWSEYRIGKMRKADGPQVFTVVGADLTPRQVTIEPGRIGIHGTRHWDAELVYLRGPHRDAKWDDLVRVAIARMWDDADLAEAALARAHAKGYPGDGVSDLVGYAIAVTRGDTAGTLAFYRVRETSGEYGAEMPVWPRGLYWAAMAEGDFELAGEAMQEAAPDVLEDKSGEVEQYARARAGGALQAGKGTPSELAEQMKHTPLLPLCQPSNQYAEHYMPMLQRGQRLRIGSQSGHYNPVVLEPLPTVTDAVVEVTLKLRKFDERETQWSRVFAVGLMDLADKRPATIDRDGMPGGILGFAAWGDKETVSVYHGSGEEVLWRPAGFKMDGKQEVTVRLVHAGGWDEVFVDEKRIAYLPWTGPCKRMGFYIKTVGMDATISSVKFDALGEID